MTDPVVASVLDDGGLGDGECTLHYEISPEDVKATRHLGANRRSAVIQFIVVHLGTPLLPSFVVLLLVQLYIPTAMLFGGFVLLTLLGTWRAKLPGWEESDVLDVAFRRGYVEIRSKQGVVRRSWSWFDHVQLDEFWLRLEHKQDVLVAVPRRVLGGDSSATALAATVTDWVEQAKRLNADNAAPPMPSFETGEMMMSEAFVYTEQEVIELLSGHLEIVDDEGHIQAGRSGCMMIMILMMIGTAGLVSQMPWDNTRKMLVWCAVCAAIWLPRVMWRLLEPARIRRDMKTIEEAMQLTRRHGIGPRGVMDLTDRAQELWHWDSVTRVSDNEAFVFVQGASQQYFATPKRALQSSETTVETATRYWKAAQAAEEEKVASKESDPGPATESGNPYQPPMT